MEHDTVPHMTPEEFRRWGHRTIDWIAEFLETAEDRPVLARVEPGEVRRGLPADPPLRGRPLDEAFEVLESAIVPGITQWQSPRFFAYFPSNTSGPSILGELLSAGLGVQGMLWSTSPACTEVETHVLDWLVGMLELPEEFLSSSSGGGVIQDSASSATLCALLAARERATGFESNRRGCRGSLAVYASEEAHSSLDKAVRIAGLGDESIRRIATDEELAADPGAFEELVRRDLDEGITPAFAVATAGTTSSNAFDPIREMGKICRRHGIWLHVDAAMSGTAALCPEHRHLQDGLELADSYCFNPHKWMLTNFDCDCFWVADRDALVRTLSVLPEYLRNRASESGRVVDYRDWQIPLGRRFRSLKLWLVIHHYGIEGLRGLVRRHVALAGELAERIEADEHFELLAPVPLNLLCFRHVGDDETSRRLLERLNASGRIFLTHTTIGGRYAIRLCVGQARTERRHVEEAWDLIREIAAEIRGE